MNNQFDTTIVIIGFMVLTFFTVLQVIWRLVVKRKSTEFEKNRARLIDIITLERVNEVQDEQKSLVEGFLGNLLAFFFIYGLSILVLWIPEILTAGQTIVFAFSVFLGIIIYHWKQSLKSPIGFILLYVLVGGLMYLSAKSMSLYALIVIPFMFLGAFIGIRWDKFWRRINRVFRSKTKSGSIGFKKISGFIRASHSFKKSNIEVQTGIISFAIIVFVLIPLLESLVPTSFSERYKFLFDFVKNEDVKASISLFSLSIYVPISLYYQAKAFLKMDKLSPLQVETLFTLSELVSVVSVVITYGVLSFLLCLVFGGIGYGSIGADFSIFLGFFVFPQFVSVINSHVITYLLLYYSIDIELAANE